ncbi:DUF4287 domain-containing protein [Rhizobium alvei]|uniref:DUF4287 domain-containing protein n=1 Tax=Rhizobium alvei TaxID=1132659 RepID=A0ABT8YP72_9HYPH|nr:DUF4287 domain-containing protein [Rhizobium alvei]MDO6965005.1 DUF4287 domain-containing protein [Rhizobium alvei]
MSGDATVRGPASYFPSIEKKYGQSIAYWIDVAKAQQGLSHMQIVAHLKDAHGLGHGHANAIVAHVLAEQKKA